MLKKSLKKERLLNKTKMIHSLRSRTTTMGQNPKTKKLPHSEKKVESPRLLLILYQDDKISANKLE